MWKQNIITYIIAYIHYRLIDCYKYYWLHYSIFLVMHYYKKYTFDQNNISQICFILLFFLWLVADIKIAIIF